MFLSERWDNLPKFLLCNRFRFGVKGLKLNYTIYFLLVQDQQWIIFGYWYNIQIYKISLHDIYSHKSYRLLFVNIFSMQLAHPVLSLCGVKILSPPQKTFVCYPFPIADTLTHVYDIWYSIGNTCWMNICLSRLFIH